MVALTSAPREAVRVGPLLPGPAHIVGRSVRRFGREQADQPAALHRPIALRRRAPPLHEGEGGGAEAAVGVGNPPRLRRRRLREQHDREMRSEQREELGCFG